MARKAKKCHVEQANKARKIKKPRKPKKAKHTIDSQPRGTKWLLFLEVLRILIPLLPSPWK